MTDHTKNDGFTLVEVLAALLIFSVSILALMRAGTQNAKTVFLLEQKTLAAIVADNQMALARLNYSVATTSSPLEREGKATQASQDFRWNIMQHSTDLAGFFRLEIEVRGMEKEQVLIKRTGFASRRAAAQIMTSADDNTGAAP